LHCIQFLEGGKSFDKINSKGDFQRLKFRHEGIVFQGGAKTVPPVLVKDPVTGNKRANMLYVETVPSCHVITFLLRSQHRKYVRIGG